MSKEKKRIVILGAGIAGLAAGWKLLRTNPEFDVTILEKDSEPGGLAKSITWNDFVLDLGPHRFHTEIDEVKEFIKTFCEERMLTVKRASRMFLNDRYIPYPISMLPTFKALGLPSTLSFSFSALGVLLNRTSKDVQSYEDYVIGYYGKSLYKKIFQPFAEKVWGIPASSIAAETARVRLRGENIWHSLIDNLFSSGETYVTEFLYPPNGIGEIADQFANEITTNQGKILFNQTCTKVEISNENITKVITNDNQVYECDYLINTIPIGEFTLMIDQNSNHQITEYANSLDYRALHLIYVLYNEDLNIDDTWLYFPEEKIPFSRICVPSNFTPHINLQGKTCLCVEFPCDINDSIWNSDTKDLATIIDQVLIPSGLTTTNAVDSLSVKIKEGYPLYRVGYNQKREKILSQLSTIKNCITTGRQGLFRHNNLDQSIQMGLHAGEYIAKNQSSKEWYDTVDRYNDYRIVD
jgi:protoporphyrinogen oxidase